MRRFAHIRRLTTAAALGASTLALGCEHVEAVPEVAAEYVLVSLGGDALPTFIWPGSTTEVLADTVRVNADGSGVRIWVHRDAPGAEAVRSVEEFSWTADGSELSVSFPCPPNALALCVAPPHIKGTVQAGLQFVADVALPYQRAAVYQAVGMR